MTPTRLLVDLGARSYPIFIGPDLLDGAVPWRDYLPQARAVVVTNETVAPLYLERVLASLRAAGVAVEAVVLPDGEVYKEWPAIQTVMDHLLAWRCERKTTLIALGGGVIGDMTGFAAAIYQRGMPFIQIPTTLLSQVDSSVGGKTGINHPAGKNMIGAFYQPRLVLADTAVLATLPDRELSAGLAEVIKYGLLGDEGFLAWLESNLPALRARQDSALRTAIQRSCAMKADIVAEDEREAGRRALLNLGHTFGHAIEAGLGFGVWLHGEAVGAGMVLAAETSLRLGWLDEAEVQRVAAVVAAAGLPVKAPKLGAARYLELMAGDKKVENGQLRLVLLRALGEAVLADDVPQVVLHEVLEGRWIDG